MGKKKQLDPVVYQLSRRLMADLDTPRSLTIDILMRHEMWDDVAAMAINPMHYLDNMTGTEKFRRDCQATSFLRKYVGLPTSIDTREAATKGFWASEAQCKQTNDRLSRFLGDNMVFDHADDARIHDFIVYVRKKIAHVLGPIPQEINPRFGPGATFESKEFVRAKFVTVCDKLSNRTSVTPLAKDIFDHYYRASAWERGVVCDGGYYKDLEYGAFVVRGNRLAFAPKDATKDRAIGIEPGGNVWLQLGVGAHMRRRLQRVGLLLNEGRSERFHKLMACRSSLIGEYATIDLSSASDTICWKLVKLLLPEAWYDLLAALRSPLTQVRCGKKSKWVLLEKFSSMGNGFTFELETLIFSELAKAACYHATSGDEAVKELHAAQVACYGDDILVPNQDFKSVIAVLKYFGFTPNEKKSFATSAFRESCGGDFFNGQLVRPYFLEEIPREPADWIVIANGLYRSSHGSAHRRSSPFFRGRLLALGQVPSAIRCLRGPERLGDVVVHAPEREWKPRLRHGILWFKVWRPVVKPIPLNRWGPGVQLAAALLGVPSIGPVPRDTVAGFKHGYVSSS